jgi:hypothetical protein
MPSCPPGTVQVGIISVKGPDGEEGCVICEDCQPPDDPSCPPLSGAGVWKLESTSTELGSTLAVGRLIEIPEPSSTSKRIVQVNTAVDVSDVITWTPDTDDDTEFSVESRSVAKKDISYWDAENCPRSASTGSGAIYVRTYDSGGTWTGTQTRISSRGSLGVNCDYATAEESNTLTYIGPGEIRDWWSVSALPGTVSGGILVTSLPIPAPDLPGPS